MSAATSARRCRATPTAAAAGTGSRRPSACRIDELRDTQLTRLRATLRNAYDNVPFYRKKLEAAGIAPDDVHCHGDACDLPFTTKIDLRDHYPFGMFAVPRDQIVRVHASSGTTGNPTVVGYTREDIELWKDLIARTLAAGGVRPGDMVQNAYGYGLFTGGLGVHYGIEHLGAAVLPISGGNTERQIKLMRDFGVTALTCTPSYALFLADAARDRGLTPDDLPVRVGFHGAEPWTNEMRAQLEAKMGIDALDIYGLSEMGGPGVSYECLCKGGMHINEDHYLAEIVDPRDARVAARGSRSASW